MGGFEFGVYVYTWTWVLLIGGMVDLGLGSAAQRFIPEYTELGQFNLLRGYLRGSRWLAVAIATAIALLGAGAVTLLAGHIGAETIIPLYLACAALPLSGVAQVQSGIARSYNWVNLGLAPVYIQRQLALLGLVALAFALGLPTNAITATLAGVISLWGVAISQMLVLNRRLSRVVESGTRAYAVRAWLATSTPIFVVEAFYLLLTYADVIIVQQFRLGKRSRHLLRRREDHGARRLYLFLGGADHRPQIRAVSRGRRPQTPGRLLCGSRFVSRSGRRSGRLSSC